MGTLTLSSYSPGSAPQHDAGHFIDMTKFCIHIYLTGLGCPRSRFIFEDRVKLYTSTITSPYSTFLKLSCPLWNNLPRPASTDGACFIRVRCGRGD